MNTQLCCICYKTLDPLMATTMTLDGEVYHFCSGKCHNVWLRKNQQFCFACGKTVFGSHNLIQYGDGRVSCQECFNTAVNSAENLQKRLRKARAFFIKNYHFTPPCGVQPELYDRFVFKTNFKLLSDDIRGVYGWAKYENYLSCTIGVLRGLPANIFEQVLVHELAHDMMAHVWKFSDNKMLSEGFAQYIAYQYNLEAGEKALNDILLSCPVNHNPENPDPYYDGLIRMLEVAEKGGYASVEQYIIKNI